MIIEILEKAVKFVPDMIEKFIPQYYILGVLILSIILAVMYSNTKVDSAFTPLKKTGVVIVVGTLIFLTFMFAKL